MTIDDEPVAFALRLPAKGSLLAIDASRRRLGLAGTDLSRSLVTPLRTLARRRLAEDLAALGTVVRERSAVGLVLGLPVNMDGSEGPMAQAARALARDLVRGLSLPLLLQDERLTSFAVEDAIAEGRLKRPNPGEATDHYAAAVILEDALRRLRAPAKGAPP